MKFLSVLYAIIMCSHFIITLVIYYFIWKRVAQNFKSSQDILGEQANELSRVAKYNIIKRASILAGTFFVAW